MPAGSSSEVEGPSGALTDTNFWDEYWASTRLPARLDLSIPGDRALARAIGKRLGDAERQGDVGTRLVEIGCAPGAWLAHFAALGFDVTGIDESPRGVDLTRRNFEMQHIQGEVIEGDALRLDLSELKLEGDFDAVISLGVIEHFADPEPIVRIHAALARPGGKIILGVPNLGGPIGSVQGRLDRAWLEKHNLETLRPGRLRAVGEAAGLRCESVTYVGGFDPRLLEWHGRSYLGFGITRLGSALRSIRASDNWNAPWLSSTVLASFEKPR